MNFESIFGGNGLQMALIAGAFTVVVGFVLFMFIRALRTKREKSYEEQLKDLLTEEVHSGEEVDSRTIFERWTNLWAELFKEMGWTRYEGVARTRAGTDVAVGWLIVAVVSSLVSQNFFIGPVLATVLVFALYLITKNVASKKSDAISDQLPGFLFALKANIQANETPERAILKVVDAMPSPLYDDLLIVRGHILSNSTFKEALLDLKEKTANRDLKFLAACMIQATASGANIEDQIVTIQEVLESRRAVTDEINQAARSASPAIWAASIAIPAAFIAIFFGDPNASGFWFVNPISWALLGVIAGLWALGVWLSRRMITQIRNM